MFCDCCKKEILDVIKMEIVDDYSGTEHLDICSDCKNDIINFIKNKRNTYKED